MDRFRTPLIHLAIAAGLATACDGVGGPGLVPDVRRELDGARHAAASWITISRLRSEVDAPTAISTGYLERLRLGLGSPFRLADQALADPRLQEDRRRAVAWAILARTIDGSAYEIDPAVLDRIGVGSAATRPGSGRYHTDLIEGAIRQSGDPRSGELAVRLAYALAAAEGAVTPRGLDLTARVAALVRDRELARRDAQRLVRDAGTAGLDPLDQLTRWRIDRRFDVERPPMTPHSSEAELHAMELAPRLARVIHDLANHGGRTPLPVERPPAPLLGNAAAAQLRSAADLLDAPPQTPVALAARLHRTELLESPWLDADEKERREAFLRSSDSEERFAAGLALLRRRSPWDNGPAMAALTAAVGLRTYAQEPVWFPGQDGPTTRELQERYGLASIAFDEDIRPAWRPYYRRMVDVSLADLRSVLPSLDVRGLHIVVGDRTRPDATLAMHDPRRRTLTLPPATSAGTLAHEIAHDLDWQIALRRYRVRGDYASDRAARFGGDRFAQRVQLLAATAFDARAGSAEASPHARRPAEIFARSIDWFVAVSLAAAGRTNGYLSSVQDEVLTGYGTVRPPDVTGTAGNALITILDEVAPVYPDTRDWFAKRYGLRRSLTPYDLVRRMLDVPIVTESAAGDPTTLGAPETGADRFAAIERAKDAGFAAIDQWLCRSPGATFHPQFEAARRELVREAAVARARGLASRLASNLAGAEASTWVSRRLYQQPGPWSAAPDSTTAAALEDVVQRARSATRAPLPSSMLRIDLLSPPEHCTLAPLGSPFIATLP